MTDRVGLGWRSAYGTDLIRSLDRIDIVEVLADGWLLAGHRRLGVLRTLAAEVPVMLHGVGLGLASVEPVADWRLDAWARLVDIVRPLGWSEHLAFVRAGDIEIGHLAAPPRREEFIDGTAANVAHAEARIGLRPLLENVATLVEPIGSTMDEPAWLDGVVRATGAGLLLDLHNLYANARNAGRDPLAGLDRLPLAAVRQVHLAGGRLIAAPAPLPPRILDDHLHDTPDAVFDLLEALAARCPQPLAVIIERDGAFPPFDRMLAEIDRARAALARGRGASS